MRVGIGYDIHPLVEGRRLIIGGVEIPYNLGLDGHSDADVLIHSVIDAILGASCSGDIGTHFPDNSPRWKDANSLQLLNTVGDMMKEKGWIVRNIDTIIIAEQPRMSPYIAKMRENIAGALGIDIDCISIKAKTNEGFDAVGRGEAISCQAIVCIE
ncbi:2-C-methyl-D-erythritol 2,4-cyclodiphosphate synthase [bacterium]|nr:MAG: 2-C-methyl-D-erythritol 2,4-cyclodiphosphate synthase [bacterium]